MKTKTTNYSPIALGEVTDGSKEWQNWRQHGPHYADPLHPDYLPVTIGGSDVSKIFCCNPWETRLEFFHKKSQTANATEAKKDEDILSAGHRFEEAVAETFCYEMKKAGVKVEMENDTNMYQHPEHPWMLANLDRRIKVNGIPGILECKTTSDWDTIRNYWQNGIVPPYYEWQCRFYMAVMNLSYCYICCVWGFRGTDNAIIKIERDPSIEEVMLNEIDSFVALCEAGKEPETEGENVVLLNKYYSRLYGEIPTSAPPVELPDTDEVQDIVISAQDIMLRKKEAEKALEKIEREEAEITARLIEITGAGTTYCSFRLNDEEVLGMQLAQSFKRDSFDEEALKAAEPEVFKKYLKESFDSTKYKKENKAEAAKYVIPGGLDTTKPCRLKKVEIRQIPVKL